MVKTESAKKLGTWNGRDIMLIPVKQLFVDESFQRAVQQHRVDEMVANFDVNALRALVVSERSGRNGTSRYSVLDGQNRLAAYQESGRNEPILCEVHTGLTHGQEAILFTKLNEVSPVSGNHKFRANLVAKQPVEMAIEKIAKDNGMELNFTPKHVPSTIRGLWTIRRYYLHYGEAVFRKSFSVIKRAFYTGAKKDEYALQPDFIRGLIQFVNYASDLTEDEIVKGLREHTAQSITFLVRESSAGQARWRIFDNYVNVFAVACDYKKGPRARVKTRATKRVGRSKRKQKV